MTTSIFQRVIEELCTQVGFKQPDLLLKGGKLRIDDYLISFIYDVARTDNHVFVYVDLGELAPGREDICRTLLRSNFELLAGSRGVISLHPKNDHIFYSFRYALNDASSGADLLNTLIQFVGHAASLDTGTPPAKDAKGTTAAKKRTAASHFFQQIPPKPE